LLNWRQQQRFNLTVTIWRAPETIVAGAPSRTWDDIAVGVRCALGPSPSQFELQAFIQSEGDNVFTLDRLHFAVDEAVLPKAGDVLQVTAGHAVLNPGYWMVRGDLQAGTLIANTAEYIAARIAVPPTGVG
jgi:hypothetical protein